MPSTAPCTSRACRSWRRSAARTTRRWSSNWQRTLLTDIPPQPLPGERPLNRWALLPGALLLVVLSLGLYLKTSDIGQVLLWQQAERHFPALLQQVKDPTAAPLRMDELAELRLGLRSHLQDTPNDLAGWQLLGRLGLLLNDGETAIGAFGRAHALSGDDPAAAFDYASALVRAGDSGQVRMGELLLRDLASAAAEQPAGAGDAGPERGA